MRTYVSQMSEQEVAKRKEWMKRVREDMMRTEKEKKVCLPHSCVHLMVPWGVHPPLWEDSLLLAGVVDAEVKEHMSVLDIGTGSGIQGVVAALRGAFVLSTDICSRAVQAARWNAERYDLQGLLEARESDCFKKIPEKFDRIFFNPPHLWFEHEHIIDRAISDEEYDLFRRFLDEAKSHLEEKGKIFVVCSTIGDVGYMHQCMKERGYNVRVCTTKVSPSMWHYAVYELT